jgi:hypothetical protein
MIQEYSEDMVKDLQGSLTSGSTKRRRVQVRPENFKR